MRPLLAFFAVLAVGLPCVSACPPVPRYAAPYRAPVIVHETPYVAPYLAAVYIPVAVPIPSFSVGYAPQVLTSASLSPPPPGAATPGYGGPQPGGAGLAPLATPPGVATAPAPAAATVPPAAAGPPETRLQQLERENADLRQRLGETAPPVKVPPQPSTGNAAPVDYVPAPGDKTPTSPGLALIGRHCIQCHSAEAAKEKGKGIVLVKDGRLAVSPPLAARAARAVKAETMPRDHGLADPEIAAILEVFAPSPAPPVAPTNP